MKNNNITNKQNSKISSRHLHGGWAPTQSRFRPLRVRALGTTFSIQPLTQLHKWNSKPFFFLVLLFVLERENVLHEITCKVHFSCFIVSVIEHLRSF